MNLSMRWLKEFVDINMDPKEFSEAMTMSGSKVEGYEIEGEGLEKIVVGKVLSLEKHPDADKLWICKIDIGNDTVLQIVTGAQNLKVGDIVPVATDGSTVFGNKKIKKGKLRGVGSNGMLCSLSELGLSLNDFPYAIEDGIFVLKEDCFLGQDIKEAIGLNDTKVEFEITSNRPDCFSIIGLAREVAATFNKELKLHTPVVKTIEENCSNILEAKIEDSDLCSFYSAKVVKNIKIQESPRWLRERLRAMNVRPINNIVDITNYVMLEYGQPMHAFDIKAIENKKIKIRRAKENEIITTLDGVERKLNSNNLVIADDLKPIAVAGVMGGEFSGITNETKTIVFESANFNAGSVRKTAKSLGLRTDSSARYEKGLDVNNCIPAMNRACELIELLCAGEVMDGIIIDDKSDYKKTKIKLDCDWINKFLNTNISCEKMIEILTKLECKVENETIYVPSFRPDLINKYDIAEEIARFYGYNNIVSTQAKGMCQGKYSKRQKFERLITDTMIGLGLSEIMTYSFISPKQYDKILMPKDNESRNSLVIVNPLGEDTSIMRTNVLPSMLSVLSKNYNNRNESAFLFELAKEYIKDENNKLPIEKNKLIAGLYGNNIDFFNIKGIVEELMNKLNIFKYEFIACEDNYSYHPGRCATIKIEDKVIGTIGEIHPTVCENYDIDCRAYSFTLDIDLIYDNANFERKYKPLPKFPAVARDLAIICDENMPVGELEKAISSAAGNILEKITLFDVYKGEQIEKGKKSVAFNIVLRSFDHTLTDEQSASTVKKIIKSLQNIGALLRS